MEMGAREGVELGASNMTSKLTRQLFLGENTPHVRETSRDVHFKGPLIKDRKLSK